MKHNNHLVAMAVLVALVGAIAMPTNALAASSGTQAMYRLYNRWNGDHLFTASWSEYSRLERIGWSGEGVAWYAPTSKGTPIYRAYNPFSGEHLYTTSSTEYYIVTSIGWQGEGMACRSNDVGTPVFRLYNRWLTAGTHLYTTSWYEYSRLVNLGWEGEGVKFYAASAA